jgi:hypothetical protein
MRYYHYYYFPLFLKITESRLLLAETSLFPEWTIQIMEDSKMAARGRKQKACLLK